MYQGIVDGATLLGTGLACYALKTSLGWGAFGFWVMTVAGVGLMLLGLWTVCAR